MKTRLLIGCAALLALCGCIHWPGIDNTKPHPWRPPPPPLTATNWPGGLR